MKPKPYDTNEDADPEDLAETIMHGLRRKATLRNMSVEERVEFYWELSRLAQDKARTELHAEARDAREDD